jgi:hypothetical protein
MAQNTAGKARTAIVIGVGLVILGLIVLGATHKYSSSDPTTADVTCGSVFSGASADENASGFNSSAVADFCDRQRREAGRNGGLAIGAGVLLIIGGAIVLSSQVRDAST